MCICAIRNELSTLGKAVSVAVLLFSLAACDSAAVTGDGSDPEVILTGEPAGGVDGDGGDSDAGDSSSDSGLVNIVETAVATGNWRFVC